MTILVTGGTGFIGSTVVKLLLPERERVLVYDRAPDNASMRSVLAPGEIAEVPVVEGDVLDLPRLFETIAGHRVDRVVHLAYLLSTASGANPWLASKINVEGTNNVFEASRQLGVRRVVWASSIAVFGPQEAYPPGPIPHDAKHDPRNLYGACKSFNERMAREYGEKYGLDTVGLRFGTGYGPGRHGGFGGWSADLIEKPALGQPAIIPFADETINWCYVEDDARAILAALRAETHPALAYNCTGEARPMRDAVAYVRSLLPQARIELRPGRFVMAHDFDRTLTERDLGWKPGFAMEQGIREYVNLVRARHGLPVV